MAKIKRITLSELIDKLYNYNVENGIEYGLQPKDKPLLSEWWYSNRATSKRNIRRFPGPIGSPTRTERDSSLGCSVTPFMEIALTELIKE